MIKSLPLLSGNLPKIKVHRIEIYISFNPYDPRNSLSNFEFGLVYFQSFNNIHAMFIMFFFQNKDVTEAIQKVAAGYDCKIVEGVLSHQLKQFVIDGNKVVLSVGSPDVRVDDAEFEENEVYAIDIVTSTGEGKVVNSDIFVLILVTPL